MVTRPCGSKRRCWIIVFVPLLAALSSCGSPREEGEEQSGRPAGVAAGSVDGVEAIVGCLQDRGLAVDIDSTIASQPGITFDNRVVSTDQFEEAYQACIDELTESGILSSTSSSTDPERLRCLYDDFVAAAECIEGLGYDVPTPPSVEVFVDSKGATWNPFDAVPPEKGPEELNRVQAACGGLVNS